MLPLSSFVILCTDMVMGGGIKFYFIKCVKKNNLWLFWGLCSQGLSEEERFFHYC